MTLLRLISGCLLVVSGIVWGETKTGEPTNAAEAIAKKEERNAKLDRSYRTWKANLPPAQQKWEDTLEANLGSFYFPHHVKDKLIGLETAWDYVEDVENLPRVLLIGDSISRGYTQAIRKALLGKANVHRAPANCGSSATGIKKLSVWLEGGPWDVIHFNFGIHDRSTSDKLYASNLEQIVVELEKTHSRLIWANTTPTVSEQNSEHFTPERCASLNAIAGEIMQRHQIPVDDLCSLVQPRLAELQQSGNVHFTDKGYDVLGAQVAAEILEILAAAPTQPIQVK